MDSRLPMELAPAEIIRSGIAPDAMRHELKRLGYGNLVALRGVYHDYKGRACRSALLNLDIERWTSMPKLGGPPF